MTAKKINDSVFAKIVRGELPCHKVYEDNYVLCFLNIYPVTRGHVLVIPKVRPKEFVFELDDELTCRLFNACSLIAKKIMKVYSCHRVHYAVDGDQVPYAHVHLIPRYENDNLSFWPKSYKASEDELIEEKNKIISS